MLPIYLCGEEIGYIERTSSGIKGTCPMEAGYIYRLELVGKITMSLGVMMPASNCFALEKSGVFTLSDWEYAEVLRSKAGETVTAPLPFALSHGKKTENFDFTKDICLKECLAKHEEIYTAIYHGRRFVYFPFDATAQRCMSAFFFCLSVFNSPKGLYAAFCIDENNLPIYLI